MTEQGLLAQITEVKDRIDVDDEPVFDEGYCIGYIHAVYDTTDWILEMIGENVSLDVIKEKIEALKGGKQE